MNIKGLEIRYQPISSGMQHIPDYSLIDTFFNKVEYMDKCRGIEGIYLFDFYDKEDKEYVQTEAWTIHEGEKFEFYPDELRLIAEL